MNRTIPILLITAAIIFGSIGCGKKCEEFNSDILTWMPYQKDDRIIYAKDGINDTITVKSTTVEHTTKVGYRTMCDCSDYFRIELYSDSLTIDVWFDNSNNVSESWVEVAGENLSFSEQAGTFQFNNKTYTDVLVYVNNSTSLTKRIDRLIIAKSVGIIGIIGTTHEWIFGDTFKYIEVTMIDYEESDCS